MKTIENRTTKSPFLIICHSIMMILCITLCQLKVYASDDNFDDEIIDKIIQLEDVGKYRDAISILSPYARKSNDKAQNMLGYAYEELKNSESALYWYKKAADLGNSSAQFNLGRIFDKRYGNDLSVNQDDDIALYYYEKALNNELYASKGRGWAACNAAIIYKSRGAKDDVKRVLETAVNKRYELKKAPCMLADWIYPKTASKAFMLYRISADNGNRIAQHKLGMFFEEGTEGLVDVDLKEAVKWYQRAADNGSWAAQERLGKCYERLWRKTQDERDLRQTLKWYYKVYSDDNSSGSPRIIVLGNIQQTDDGGIEATSESPLRRLYDEGVLNASEYKTYEDWETNYVKKLALDSDVDVNIPERGSRDNLSYALIIANEDYEDAQLVPYAINDGEIFKRYCASTLGIPDSNIKYLKNATLNQITKGIDWIVAHAQIRDINNIVIYYSGHGMPAEDLSTSFLFPVDGSPKNASTGYDVKNLYQLLGQVNCNSVIFLDACFSGASKSGQMLVESRGIALKAPIVSPESKTVVFSACSGTETAYPFNNQKHGLFTYYLLKHLQESKGKCSLGDLYDYVSKNVQATSIEINHKSQTPSIASSDGDTDWSKRLVIEM